MHDIAIGDIVKTTYNSGIYIGKVLEDRNNFYLVEVLAVDTHPTQGDLHQRGKVDGVAFHERKALAYKEKTNARKRFTERYDGKVPDYVQSLKEAVDRFRESLLEEASEFNRVSLQKLQDLETHYYNKLFQQQKGDE